MTDVSAVLDIIDDTLTDFSVSRDAMRWQPEEEREAKSAQMPDLSAFPQFAEVMAAIGRDLVEFARAAWDSLKAACTSAVRMVHDVHRALYPRKHKRCVTCHPRPKPKPLAVDGHEYRRRQLARRRRRR